MYSLCTLGTVDIFLYVNNSKIRLPATAYSMLCWVRPDFFSFRRTWNQPSFGSFRELVPQKQDLVCFGQDLAPGKSSLPVVGEV